MQTILNIIRRLLLLPVHGYRYFISPMLGHHCRYHPSCSQYTIDAVNTHGVCKGGWLAIKRILRCHPWHKGGIDNIPAKRLK